MSQAFICYANQDSDFADLVAAKLKNTGIEVWLDHGAVRAGKEWRSAIDQGIAASDVLIVLLTKRSCESAYVTYEWAFALGMGKKVIPLLRENADLHPRLDALQYLDFTDQRAGPWQDLVREIGGTKSGDDTASTPAASATDEHAVARDRILQYLERTNHKMMSFEKIRQSIDPQYSDDFLFEVIRRHYTKLRTAMLKGKRQGVARLEAPSRGN